MKTSKPKKITEVLNLFSINSMLLKSTCFIDEDETFVKEIKELFDCDIKIVFTKTRFFSKKKYSKVDMSFKGEHIAKAIALIVKQDLSLGIDCYNAANTLALQFVVNDNSGACVTFNPKIFNVEVIKSNVKKIFE